MSSKKQTWANAHSQLWTSPAPRSAGSRTQSEVSSIASLNRDRSLLDDVDIFDRANDGSALSGSHLHGNRSKERTLVQVSDILESYGVISKESDIPAVLLSVIKELEEAKRENSFKDLLLREYGDVVRRRFCLYGDDSPPSVAELSRRLRDGTTAKPAIGPAPVWLEDQLNELRCSLQNEFNSCFGEEIDFSLPTLLPDATHTQSNISQIFQKSREVLARLSNEYKDAKRIIMGKLDNMKPSSNRRSALTLAEALTELDSRQPLDGNVVANSDSQDEKGHTFKVALQSIVDTIPASLQIHFQLQVNETPVLNQCNNLKRLLKFLLSEYLSMERYMEEVEKQRCKLVEVFRLPSTQVEDEGTADDKAQIDDALMQSLENLKKTVTAVVTFPHYISEEEISLRRTSTEAVEELAQLLVESRHTGSTTGTSGPLGASGSSSMMRIEPPTRNLLEMVAMVKSRFATLFSQQQRKELAGVQSRIGLAHMEEAMKSQGKQIMQLLREMYAAQDGGADAEQSDALSELMGSFDTECSPTPMKLDYFLSDVVERLRMVRTKYQRALSAAASNKTRAENATQKCSAAQKKLHKIAVCVERIGKDGLGLTFPFSLNGSGSDADDAALRGGSAPEIEGGRSTAASALRRMNLRPASDASLYKAASSSTTAWTGKETAPSATEAGTGAAVTVTEGNVLEALQFLATRVCANDVLRDQVKLRDELEQLRNCQAQWKADTSAFHEAMSMLMHRLASNGQLVKQSLFMMGTDESAKDDLVEEVLQHGGGETDEEAEAEYVERSLAQLLQKYTRWAQRLQQTTEDHLYTQRKIVKYFAAVRRFFTSQQSKEAAPQEDIPDDNLYDIDSCLMRAADAILPALDAAIQDVEGQRSAATAASLSPLLSPKAAVAEGQAPNRQDTIKQLAKDSAAAAAGGVLPYDHRIARLYEMVARLYTAVTSLLQVHYLSMPTAVKRRSTGDIELIFDGDGEENGFVDIDLDRLIRVSQRRNGGERDGMEGENFTRESVQDGSHSTNSPPPATVATNNDIILRVTYQNMEVLQDTLKCFSANHKMAAIVMQKDMDAMQQQLASMLEKYSELDIETAFHQSRDELHELYLILRDRAQVQKGCYFFNRVGGEGSCTWVTALERLGEGFRGVVDRLVQRTAQVAKYGELVDEVVDMCAMYVNWAEHHALPPSHALPPQLLALCLRDGKETTEEAAAGVDATQIQSLPTPPLTAAATKTAQRPPKPCSTPSLTPRDSIKRQQKTQEGQGTVDDAAEGLKVSSFTEDRAVLKVMQHMFQLAQHVAEKTDASALTANAAATQEAETRAQQLAEELSLLREAVTVAERHVDELTEIKHTVELERDQAQSEAAVARAELRRWKRQQQQHQQCEDVGQATPQTLRDSDRGRAIVGASPNRAPQPSSTSDAPSGYVAMDEATIRDVMAYMKLLSEELQMAKQQAGAGVHRETHLHHWRRWQQQGKEEKRNKGRDELLQSPRPAELSDKKDEDPYGNTAGRYGDVVSHAHPPPPPSNRYAALAEELRHRYGSSAWAPTVVVDPQVHYSAHRSSARGQRRYSPVRFHSPAYNACDRYYVRELTDKEGERARQQSGGSSSGSLYIGALQSAASLQHSRATPQRPSRRGGREEGEVHYEAYVGNTTDRRVAGPATSAATPHRYPRSLAPSETFRVPAAGAAGVATPAARIYQALPRATPVTSCACVPPFTDTAQQRSPTVMAGRAGAAPGDDALRARHSEDDEERNEEVFCDDADWRVSPQRRRRPSSSSARHRTVSTHSTSPGMSSSTLSRSGHAAPPAPSKASPSFPNGGPASNEVDRTVNLAEAVQQIEAATHQGRSTPARRSTHPHRTRDNASNTPPTTPEKRMSNSANLRSTTLRRLAEVVSRTKVAPPNGARF